MEKELLNKPKEEEPDLTTEELEGMKPIGPEAKPDLTPEITGEETGVEKKKNFWEKTKEILSNREIQKQFGKTSISTIASITGVKSLYDVPEYFRERFKVRRILGQGKGLEGSMEELMAASQEGKERREKPAAEKEEGEHFEVREAIEDLNSRLKLTKEGSQKGSEQRNLIAKMLWENRHKETALKEERHEEITKILDDYTTTKVTGIQATRESLNTLFVASGTYGLRGLSYGALALIEREQRIEKEMKKEGKKGEKIEKLKRIFVDGVKETALGAVGVGKGTKKEKILRGIKSWGTLLRFAGITSTMTFSPESYNIDKVLDTLEGKTSWSEIGNNFYDNFERVIETPGKLKKLAGFGASEAEAEPLPFSAEGKIAEAVEKAKGIQGLKQMVADKFGLNIEDLKDVTGDNDVGNDDIAQIQSEKLGGFELKEPLSGDAFKSLEGEDNLVLVKKILADGQPSETELNILKSDLPDKIRLALLGDSANQAQNLENIQKIAASNPEIMTGLDEVAGNEEIVRMAQIPKGGNISEVLDKAMAKDSAITVINPDGTKIVNFDANLVHPGDTVIETSDGEIIVLKTSGMGVEEGMSLEGIYDKIQTNLDKEGIPQEVQDYFNTNRAQGGWLGRIDAAEAKNTSEFWGKYGGKINELPPEQREEFLKQTDFNKPEEVEKNLNLLEQQAIQAKGPEWELVGLKDQAHFYKTDLKDFSNEHGIKGEILGPSGDQKTPDVVRFYGDNEEEIYSTKINPNESSGQFLDRAKGELSDLTEERESEFDRFTGRRPYSVQENMGNITANEDITIEKAKLAGINIFDKDGISAADRANLEFWGKNSKEMGADPEDIKKFFAIANEPGIGSQKALENIDLIKSDFDNETTLAMVRHGITVNNKGELLLGNKKVNFEGHLKSIFGKNLKINFNDIETIKNMENGRIRLNGSFIIDPETHKVIEMQSLTAPESMPAVPTGAEIISPAPAPGREPIDEESFRRGVDYGDWKEKSAAAAPAGLRDVDQGEWEQPPVGAEKIETGIEYKTSLSDKNELLLNGEPVISPNGEIVKVEGGGDITHEIKSLPGGKVLIENQVIVDPTTKRAISRIDFNSLGLSEDNLHYAHTGPNYLVPGEQIIYLDGKRIYSARLIPKINLDGGPLQIETLPDGKIKIEGNIIVDPKTNFATVIETPSS